MKKYRVIAAAAVAVMALGLIAPAHAADNPVKLTPPKELVGVPALPRYPPW